MSAILALLKRAFAGMEGRIDPPSSLARLSVDDIVGQARTGEIWTIGDQACVFLTPRPNDTLPTLYLSKLAVDPAAQGRGFGKVLVKQAEQRALAQGFGALTLQTRVELIENHAIFRRLGFSKIAETAHPGFDRPTSFTFRKMLT